MRLLVTGGAGFIGSHIVASALASGWEVAVIDDLSTGNASNLHKEAQFFEIDLRDATAVDRVFSVFKPEIINHQAAQASVATSVREPQLDATINLLGGLNLLQAVRDHGVEQVIYASTGGAIYGEVREGQRADLKWQPRPISPYAVSKLAFEYYLQVYSAQYDVDYTILRYANVYGPRQNPHGEAGVVAIFFERLRKKLPLHVNAMHIAGDEGCIRDYIYVQDVVHANMLALEGKLDNKMINVGTGVATSTLELVKLIRAVTKVEVDVEFCPPRQGDLKRSVLEPQGLTGTRFTLQQGLRETADWFSKE
jgi:UDP-glucose 4-epimerase